ncbi:hypothetical protein FACS1894152_5570 [Bacilli bacterium]|nr:hypothetical protein FACS1894152_5570 [Bacilli bacterium]
MNTILKGNIFYCRNSRVGTEIITDINVLDGGNYYRNGFINKSYEKDTPWDTIVGDIVTRAKSYGIEKGYVDKIDGNILKTLTLNTELKHFRKDGYSIFIEHERIYIVRETGFINYPTLRIDKTTGLLNIPTRYDEYVEVSMMMESSAKLGQKVILTSELEKASNGNYRIMGIQHRGTIGFQGSAGECTTTLELQKAR